MKETTPMRLLACLLALLLLAACSLCPYDEPIDRGWSAGFTDPGALAEGSLHIVSARYRPRAGEWCYEFVTERTTGEFCSADDLGYAAGDILRLTLEAPER